MNHRLRGVAVAATVLLLLVGCSNTAPSTPLSVRSTVTPGSEPSIDQSSTGAEATEAATPTTFKALSFKGRGDKLVKFTIPDDAAAIAVLTHTGSSNFVVTSLDASGGMNELLVNEIGRFKGTRLFDTTSHSAALKIEADGAWTLAIKPITQARAWDLSSTATGTGDDVLRITRSVDGLAASTIKHSGESNFVVTASSSDGRDLLVNEIGKYSGEVQIPSGLAFLEIEADGKWSVTIPR